MPFFQQYPRRGPDPQDFGTYQSRRQRPYFYANQARPERSNFFSNQGRQPPNYYPNQSWPQPYQINPYEPTPPFGGLSDNLNTLMGHAGTITNGVNLMRQIGSFISLLR